MKQFSNFLKKLVDIECIKFGDFTLKSGIQSPIYIDLRNIVSYPNLLQQLAAFFVPKIDKNIDIICGVPYAALPMATAVSLQSNLPMLIKRKEAKGYGTKKLIEGKYKVGDKILLIEDVITSGESLKETITELEKEGLIIEQILIVLDREQGGTERLINAGYNVESLFTISSLMEILLQENKVDNAIYQSVKKFLSNNNVENISTEKVQFKLPTTHQNPIAQRLLDIAHTKQSNIIASVDLTTKNEILIFLEKIGNKICAAKLHIDIISDFDKAFIQQLKELSNTKNFLLIEDRKFADIGNTQLLQLTNGIYEIASWADFVTIHLIAGEASLQAIQNCNINKKIALIPVIEMSSQGALTTEEYIAKCASFMYKYDCVVGAVCQKTKVKEGFLKFTPGVNLSSVNDNKGQQYNTPSIAITALQSHFLIIGRGLYLSQNPEIEIEKYLHEVKMLNIF